MKTKLPILFMALVLAVFFLCQSCDSDDGPCSDQCISGETDCSGGHYRTCGNYDSDNCLDWSDDNDCDSDEICLDDICQNLADVSTSAISLSITDICNDGYQINYRFFDVDHDLAWPTWESQYYTESYNVKYTSSLSCIPGANICFGAAQGDRTWGVGLDMTQGCQDCCVTCSNGVTFGWNLTCS